MIKTFRRHPKRANLSGLSPAFSSCIIYTLLVEIQRNFEIPLVDFCETSHNRRRGPKVAHFRLFFHVTLTPNRYILHVIVIDCLSPCIPCIPCIPMYTLYTLYTLYTHVYPCIMDILLLLYETLGLFGVSVT